MCVSMLQCCHVVLYYPYCISRALPDPPLQSSLFVCRMSRCVLSVVGGPVAVNADVDIRSLPWNSLASSRERHTCTVDETTVTTVTALSTRTDERSRRFGGEEGFKRKGTRSERI